MDNSHATLVPEAPATAPVATTPPTVGPDKWSRRRLWSIAIGVGIVVAFALLAATRLHEQHLFNPDSADYVLQAGAMARGHGYRHVEDPNRALQTIRPPGLSLLLVPSQWVAPYDTVGPKVTVAVLTILLLGCAMLLAARWDSPGGGLLVLALLASSPLTLLYGTEVLSEVPFALATLALLLILDRESIEGEAAERSRWRTLCGAVLLALIPLLRTIGIAMVAAVGLWSLVRRRWDWLMASLCGAVSFLGWSVVARSGAGPSYFDRLSGMFAQEGLLGTARRCGSALAYHIESLFGNVVPNPSGQSLLSIVAIDAPPSRPTILLTLLAAVLVVIGTIGLVRRRSPAGFVSACYLVAYLLCLALWPFRQERFAWPLVPLVVVGVPAGWSWLSARFERRTGLAMGGLAMVAVIAWNLAWTGSTARTSLAAQRDRFHAETDPPFYYCDWAAAGRWVESHTPPETRVLSRHAGIALTGRRHVQLVRFESATPKRLHEEIERFGARFLVVPAPRFTQMFPWHLLDQDPVYEFEPVHEERGVTILAVYPNRTGIAREEPSLNAVATARAAFQRHPGREDLRLGFASALADEERHAEVVELLSESTDLGANGHLVRARSLRELGRYDEARRSLAAGLRTADVGARSAIQREHATIEQHEKTDWTPAHREALLLARARWHADRFDFRHAESLLSRVENDSPDASKLRSLIDARLGREGDPILGLPPATALLETSRVGIDFEDSQPASPEPCLATARRLVEDGIPGRALALLEDFEPDFADSPTFLLQLAELQIRFALWNRAERTLRRIRELDPSNESAGEQLERLETLRRPPEF